MPVWADFTPQVSRLKCCKMKLTLPDTGWDACLETGGSISVAWAIIPHNIVNISRQKKVLKSKGMHLQGSLISPTNED